MTLSRVLQKSLLFTVGLLVATLLVASAGIAQPSQAQDPPDQQVSREVLVNYSLFYEYYKNKNYESASKYLDWLLENAPTFRGTTNWERGIKMFEGLAKAAQDPAMKKAYLDSALALHDQVLPTFEEAGKAEEVNPADWAIRRGRFLQTHINVYRDRQDEVLDAYLKAYELAPEEVGPYYIKYIVSVYVRQGKKQTALDFMEDAQQTYANNQELISYFNETRNELFTSPKERVTFLEGRLEDEPENVEILSELLGLYTDMENSAKVEEIGTRLLELEPSAQTYKQLADMKDAQGLYSEAMSYYQSALEIAEDPTMKRNINYSMAQVQKEQGNLPQARQYARAALAIDSDFGEAWMLIGDLYSMAVRQSGSMERTDRAVYWLVLDMYERAKQVDPSVRAQANRSIQTYSQYIPARDALFFEGWEEGESYTIDYGPYSWINETTTVRMPAN